MTVVRKCTTCGFEIYDISGLELFEFDKEAKYNRRNRCLECKAKRNKQQNNNRKVNKALRVQELGSECKHCGLTYNGKNASVFDFHHLDPEVKETSPSELTFSLDKLREETEGCILLCSNCHRLEHNAEY